MKRKEAIEVIKKNWPDSSFTMLRDALETLIPELKESEDEKIRKWLICTLKSLNSTAVQIDGAYEMMLPAIAWLEKQGEKGTKRNNEEIPNSDWSEEDEKILSDIIKDLVHPWNEYIPDRIEYEIKWLKNRLKSLRPQKINPRFPQYENIVDKVFGAGNLETCEREEAEQLVLLAKEELLKDLALTWEDMRELHIIFTEVDVEIELGKTDIKTETLGYYQEVLKRFKAKKGE